MSAENTNFRELFTRSLTKIAELKAEVEKLKSAAQTPIAVVGMSCRFPGGGVDPESYWQALSASVDGIRRIPATRWTAVDSEGEPPATRWAGLLDSVDRFDAAFFGLSPREVIPMDPQQRLLLEVSWEALERSGLVAERLQGTRTGVFLGMSSFDYPLLLASQRRSMDVYSILGGLASTAAGRLSYTFGFQGPCVTLDTACSSSLTALHLACQSLRNRESDLVLAGGVNLILAPANLQMTAELQAMSPDGRCKTFDAEANGFAVGEGCGVVVLKRLADAERDGDPILAVVRSSAVNQDGRSTGLTAPNVRAQQALLRRCLELARVSPEEIGYVETHGTGTSLGDPIEFEALRAVLGKPRPDGSRCVLGAVKTNVGHLSAASGVAGFIKAVLCLQHGAIPANLHFRTLNPRMSLAGTPFVIPTEKTPWPRSDRPRLAGVSSFGISGTNAHVILEEAPRRDEAPRPAASSYLLPLSAKTPEALRTVAHAYRAWLAQNPDVSLHDVAYTASVRRSHFAYRSCAFGTTNAEIQSSLADLDRSDVSAARTTDSALTTQPKIVFVFSGQGSQWTGMGLKLYREEPVFRDTLVSCDQAIQKEAGFSILAELEKPHETSRLAETLVAQPALFAVEVALSALLQSWGVRPTAVIGHSLGEVVAAYVAGMLDLPQAARLVTLRARVMQQATGHGKMVSAELTEAEAQEAAAELFERVGIAAVNDPTSVVLSGDGAAIDQLVSRLAERGVSTRPLRVNYAFHSPQMDQLIPEFLRELGTVAVKPGSLTMISTVTGKPLSHKQLETNYWGQNIRQTVRFADAIHCATDDGHSLFVEVGPHPVLAVSLAQTLSAGKNQAAVISTLRREADERKSALLALAALYTHGCEISWQALFAEGGRVAPLPSYPWQKERYWIELNAQSAQPPKQPAASHADLFYAIDWCPRNHTSDLPSRKSGMCLVFMDKTGIGDALVTRLEARGVSCVKIFAGQYADYHQVLRDSLPSALPCLAVVHLYSLDATPSDRTTVETLDADLLHGTLSAAYLAAALEAYEGTKPLKLCLITRAAQVVNGEDTPIAVSQTPLWGLGRSLALEHQSFQSTLIDLPQHVTDAAVDSLLREILCGDGDTQIALRPSGRYVARLVREERYAQLAPTLRFHADASYLITGGLGDLGRALAGWMIENGARHLALVSRRPPSADAQRAISAMQEFGARIVVLTADVSQPEEVKRLLAALSQDMPRLRGIIHAAGTVQASSETTAESLLAVAAAKVRGGWNLHQATFTLPLDFFVMYSSASAILGLLSGAGYAAANAFLDGLAQARRGQGLPALSLEWGAFGEAGMLASRRGETAAFGALEPLRLQEAHGALAQALAAPASVISVMRLSAQRHIGLFPQLAGNFFWSALAEPAVASQAAHPRPARDRQLREKLLAARPDRRYEQLALHVQQALSQILRLEGARLAGATFHALGMDSLMCLELRNRLEADLGIKLSIKDIFASGKLDALVALLAQRLWGDSADNGAQAPLAPGSWVVRPRPNPDAALRLICFPYAGGNASVYTPWLDLLPPQVELCAIQPPGRQERAHEPLLSSVADMVAALLPDLLPFLDRPFVMFGHCVGAMVMYETIRALEEQHGRKPLHIFPSGAMPPPQYLLPPVLTSPSTDEFLGILRLLGFAAESILNDEESVRDLLPAVSADFNLAIHYTCGAPRRLDMPMTVFCGREDSLGPPDRTAAWKQLTTARFEQVVLPGEHYFITPERKAVLQIINEELLHHLAVLAQKAQPAPWIWLPAPRRDPALRLFCFPGAWESPTVFTPWPALLGEDIELCVIERPGFGTRSAELPLRRVDDLVDFIVPALLPYLDRPFAFLGHNIGSIMMYEVTRRLRRAGLRLPFQLFVAATDAPHLYWSGPIHLASTERILESLRLVHVAVDPDLPERLLRADGALLVSYSFVEEALLDVPITAFLGEADHFVPREALRGWKDVTRAAFDLHILPADHNLILHASHLLAERIQQVCGAALAPARASMLDSKAPQARPAS